MTSSLIDFLEARLREDEDTALAWPEDQHGWKAAGSRYLSYASGLGEQVGAVNVGGDYYGWDRIYVKSDLDDDLAGYIVRHDPARVLREVEAKRRVMARHCPDMQRYTLLPDEQPYADYCRECENSRLDDCPELRDLAAVFSDHSDYREEWKP